MSEEDEYGFKKPEQPSYYDEGLEKTRETLNEKIGQLNSAIDNVSSRLRGRGKKSSTSPVETDAEVEATTWKEKKNTKHFRKVVTYSLFLCSLSYVELLQSYDVTVSFGFCSEILIWFHLIQLRD